MSIIDDLMVHLVPKPVISGFLAKKRGFALDRRNDNSARADAVSLLTHHDFVDDVVKIATDKEEDYGVRMYAILQCLRYQAPKHDTDVITDANGIRKHTLLNLVTDKTEERLIRLDAIRALSEHIEAYSGSEYPLIGIITDKSESYEIRAEAIQYTHIEQSALCYRNFMHSVICIVEDENEDSDIRRRAIRKLDPSRHKDILWALKKDQDHDIRYAATSVLHAD